MWLWKVHENETREKKEITTTTTREKKSHQHHHHPNKTSTTNKRLCTKQIFNGRAFGIHFHGWFFIVTWTPCNIDSWVIAIDFTSICIQMEIGWSEWTTKKNERTPKLNIAMEFISNTINNYKSMHRREREKIYLKLFHISRWQLEYFFFFSFFLSLSLARQLANPNQMVTYAKIVIFLYLHRHFYACLLKQIALTMISS